MDPRIKNVTVEVACDCRKSTCRRKWSILCVWTPKRCNKNEMVKILDDSLKHYADKIKEQFNIDYIKMFLESGAAGG